MNMRRLFILTTTLIILSSAVALAQLKKSKILKVDMNFYPGKITLIDGSKLEGEVNFNDNDGIVAFRSDDEVNYYNSKNITGFEFIDPNTQRNRFYFVMEYNDPRVGIPKFCFFEVLKEFKSFAVLAKIDPIAADVQRPMGIPTNKAMSSKSNNNMVATQVETIYFMSEDGNLEPYIEIIEKETEKSLVDYNRTRYRFLDEDLFERYTRPFYKELVEYAEAKYLTFKKKSDVIALLDHYQHLLSQ